MRRFTMFMAVLAVFGLILTSGCKWFKKPTLGKEDEGGKGTKTTSDSSGGKVDVMAMMLKSMKASYYRLHVPADAKVGWTSSWKMGTMTHKWAYVGEYKGHWVVENSYDMPSAGDMVFAYCIDKEGVVKWCFAGAPGTVGKELPLADKPATATGGAAKSDAKVETKWSTEKVKVGAGEFEATRLWTKTTMGGKSYVSTSWYAKKFLPNPMMMMPKGKDGKELGTLLKVEANGQTSMELVAGGSDAKSQLKLP